MPDKQSHLAVADRNRQLIDRILNDGNSHPDWVAVIAFYRALHIVDAILYVDHPERHGGSHENRSRILKTTNRYHSIYKHYRPLFAASLVGRYLEVDGRDYRCFADYLPASQVVSTLLNHHLRQLEKSAERILGPLSPPSPPPA